MKILALEPFHGGSHQAFLDGWSKRSRHQWTLLTLPAIHWKWRMRHAAISFAEQTAARSAAGETWDVIFCTDMLNLAEFLGLADESVKRLPTVAYFHENQLTYPVRREEERDYHYAFTNLTTCLAAAQVWFNSIFHRTSFLEALDSFLRRMPDHRMPNAVQSILNKSKIFGQGIDEFPLRGPRPSGPLHIMWAARWEHDKNPDDFFAALELLKKRDYRFRLSVLGGQYDDAPEVFTRARESFSGEIEHWGYQPTRGDYRSVLGQADVIVSTAHHDFLGVSVVEAIAAGAYPLLPRRLAYPEILGEAGADRFFYDGTVEDLAGRLVALANAFEKNSIPEGVPQHTISRFFWSNLAPQLDCAIEDVM